MDLAHPSLYAMPSTDTTDIRLKHNNLLSPHTCFGYLHVHIAALAHKDNIMSYLAYAIGSKAQRCLRTITPRRQQADALFEALFRMFISSYYQALAG